MKFLGIDFGSKRIGVAISDENGVLAFPNEILANNAKIFVALGAIIKKEKVEEIVIGESLNFAGEPNDVFNSVEIFIAELEERFALPVARQKEFLTSVEARRSKDTKATHNVSGSHSKLKQTKSSRVDASAAALILQRYLDKINKKKQE